MCSVLDLCRHVINYSNDQDYGVSNLKLQKLLYFIQAYFLIETEDQRPCFAERIEAWDFGPVVPKAYREYKQFGSVDIPQIRSYVVYNGNNMWKSRRVQFLDNILSPQDKILAERVVDKFADYSATDLVSLTQRQSPWINAYVLGQNNEITLNSLKEYFNR